MAVLTELLHLPSLWLLVIGVVLLIVVKKVIRSAFGAVTGLIFTVIGLLRLYAFLTGKL